MSKTDGGAAFPLLDDPGSGLTMREPGMTLRDYFAGQALAGIAANPDISKSAAEAGLNAVAVRESYAAAAFATADVMLAERAK
jgi:hypothetical protein